jgi:hypothetical protein
VGNWLIYHVKEIRIKSNTDICTGWEHCATRVYLRTRGRLGKTEEKLKHAAYTKISFKKVNEKNDRNNIYATDTIHQDKTEWNADNGKCSIHQLTGNGA